MRVAQRSACRPSRSPPDGPAVSRGARPRGIAEIGSESPAHRLRLSRRKLARFTIRHRRPGTGDSHDESASETVAPSPLLASSYVFFVLARWPFPPPCATRARASQSRYVGRRPPLRSRSRICYGQMPGGSSNLIIVFMLSGRSPRASAATVAGAWSRGIRSETSAGSCFRCPCSQS